MTGSIKLLAKHEFFHRINGDKELKDSAVRVAGFLMWRLNCKREECWPGRQTIADALGMSVRTVGDALRALKDRGWITWRERRKPDGTPMTSVFTFVWDRAQADDNSYVYSDKNRPQDPDAIERAGKTCQGVQAKSASITTGRVTQEDTSLSSASPTKESEPPIEKKASPSAEPLQHETVEWWQDRIWNTTGPRFKAAYYPTISMAAFKKRLGETLRRQAWDIPTVDRALCQAMDAEPGCDAWQYVAGILRRRAEAGPDYSKQPTVRGVM